MPDYDTPEDLIAAVPDITRLSFDQAVRAETVHILEAARQHAAEPGRPGDEPEHGREARRCVERVRPPAHRSILAAGRPKWIGMFRRRFAERSWR